MTLFKAFQGKILSQARAALFVAALVGFTLSLTRCAIQEDQGAYSLKGVVAAGLVKSATVSVYALSSSGTLGKLLAQTRTDTRGNFLISTSLIPQPIEIVVTNGNYLEEAGGAKVELQSQQMRLRLAKFVFGQQVGVTPLTEIAAARSQILIDEVGASLSDSITTANIALAMASGLTDITVAPIYPTDAVANGLNLSSNQVKYALFISGISKFSQGVLPNSLSAMVGFSRDFAPDGTFDGKANGTTVYFGSSAEPVPATGWTPGLLNAMVAYATSSEGIIAGFGGA
ncbi:hypothetical protein EBQ90_05780, partial [bacterium]|nr:hypothetical protein [bacterium]